MEISILNIKKLSNIPSGSGIAKYGEGYYVISDDSPHLFLLNKEFDVVSKILISDTEHFNGDRIIKSEKADFETLEMIDDKELVVFGSGSKIPQRDVFVRILLNDPVIVEKYDISKFYNHLRSLPIFENSELNIEATAFRDGQLYLFNRRKNIIIKVDYSLFLEFIKGEIPIPDLEIHEFSLPKIKGIEAGFSGATTLQNQPKIVFTASVEDNINAYEDGEILGSFIGTIDISNNMISNRFDHCEIPIVNENFKVESVTIEEEIAVGKIKVVLITDDDQGSSAIIESIMSW